MAAPAQVPAQTLDKAPSVPLLALVEAIRNLGILAEHTETTPEQTEGFVASMTLAIKHWQSLTLTRQRGE